MKKVIFTLCLLIGVCSSSFADWIQSNGPFGGHVQSLKRQGTTLYASTSRGFFVSTDAGASWTYRRIDSYDLSMGSLLILYASATEIFVSRSSDAVYRTTDEGLTWTKVNAGLPVGSYSSMTKLSNGTYLLGGYAMYTSPDGLNWSPVGPIGSASSFSFIVEANGAVYTGAQNFGVFRSTDMGLTWQAVNNGLQPFGTLARPGALVAVGTDLYLATLNMGVFKSINNGDTWTSYSNANSNLLQVVNNELYLMSSTGTLYRNSPAANNSWTQINSFSRISSQSIADFAILGNEVFVSNNGFGIWKATLDQPATVAEANNQLLAGVDVNAIVSLNNVLFAGTERMGVYKSLDGGLTWQYSSDGIGSYMITGMAAIDNDIYALTINAGIYKSSDLGSTWTLFNAGLGTNYIISFTKAGNDFYAGGSSGRIYRSTGGTSPWQLVNAGLPLDGMTKLVYNGNYLFVCTNSNRVYRLDQSTGTWSPFNNGLPLTSSSRTMIADGSKLYVSFNFGQTSVFQSTDNGNSWTPAAGGIPAYTTINDMFVLAPGQIIGLSDNELYKTTDGGLCWKGSSAVTGFKPSYSSVVHYFNNKIFAAPPNNGIWYRSIDETPVTSASPPPVITGPSSVCNPAGTNLIYSVTPRSGASYNWTIPAGSTLISSTNTSSVIYIRMGNTSGTIAVTENNLGCVSAAATKDITVGAPVTPVISGPANVCVNATGNVYSVQSPVAGSTYTWSVSQNATYTSISPTSISVTFAQGAGGVFVYETNNGCNGTTAGKSVLVGSASQGPLSYSTVCEDGLVHVYVEGGNGNSVYDWTVAGNAEFYYNENAPYVYLSTTSGRIDVTVQETTQFGCVGPVLSAQLHTVPKPQTSAITGAEFVCATSLTTTYSVANTVGSYYQWSVPFPASIISGDGTNTIEVDWAGTSGQITVIESQNSCFGVQQSKEVTVVPNTSIDASTINGPASVCLQQEVDFSVAGKQGSTFTWTVPSGAVLLSGQGTPQLHLKVNNASGTVSVLETDVCNNTGPVNTLSLAVHGYAIPSQQITCASNTFCQTIQAAAPIAPGVIGLDFALHYDANLMTPTGRLTLGPVATSYGLYAVNTTTPGVIYITLYLNQAPSNVFFSGTGDIACVEFSRTAAFTPAMTTQITADLVVESTLNSTNEVCAPEPATVDLLMLVKGKLTYRNTTRVILPSATTAVQPTDQNCAAVATPAIGLSPTGTFQVATTGPLNLRVDRDIVGDATVDPLNCSNVMLAINATDRNRAADISTYKVTNPTVYELISADVNLDGKVTAGDVTLISARSVNLYNCEFPQSNYTWNGTAYVPTQAYQKSKDWIFVPSALLNDPVYTAGMNKNNVPQFPVCSIVQPISPCNSTSFPSIEGILLGDVNGNWAGGASYANIRTDAPELTINLDAAVALGNDQYLVPVSCDNIDQFSALDFEIDYNGSQVSMVNVTSANASADFGFQWNNVQNEKLFVTSFSEVPQADAAILLYITMYAPQGLSATDMSSAIAYINDQEARVNWRTAVTGNQNAAGTLVVDAYPNPFSDQFSVLLYSAKSSDFTITVTDVRGTEVYRNTCTGNQTVHLGNDLPAGVYLLKVMTSDETQVMKMVKQ